MARQFQGEGVQFRRSDIDVIGCREFCVDVGDGAGRQFVYLNPVGVRVFVAAGRKAHAVGVTVAAKLFEPVEDRFVFVSVFPTVMADAGVFGVFDMGAEVLQPLGPFSRAFGFDDRISAALKEMHRVIERVRREFERAFGGRGADRRNRGPDVGAAHTYPHRAAAAHR